MRMKAIFALSLCSFALPLFAGSPEDLKAYGDSSWANANSQLKNASKSARQAGYGDLANKIDAARNRLNADYFSAQRGLNSTTSNSSGSLPGFSYFNKTGSFADAANMDNSKTFKPLYKADGTLYDAKPVNPSFKAMKPASEVLAEHTRLTDKAEGKLAAVSAPAKAEGKKEAFVSKDEINSIVAKAAGDDNAVIVENAVVDPMKVSKERILLDQEHDKYKSISKSDEAFDYNANKALYEIKKAQTKPEASHLTPILGGASGITGVSDGGGDNSVYLGNASGVVSIPSDPYAPKQPSLKKIEVPLPGK